MSSNWCATTWRSSSCASAIACSVEFDVAALPDDLEVPALLLQPLIENAVYHGIEQMTGGTISIRGTRADGMIRIDIRNPRPPAGERGPGRHGVALANTRSRIEYHFGRRGGLDIDAGADYFACSVRLPCHGGDGKAEAGRIATRCRHGGENRTHESADR